MKSSYHRGIFKNPVLGIGLVVVMIAAVGTTVFLGQKQLDVRQRAAVSSTDIIGGIDVATCNVIQGWTCDKTNRNTELFVTVFWSGGQATTKANITRSAKAYNSPEIEGFLSNSLCGGRPNIGWNISVPQELKTDGITRSITVFAGDTNPASSQVLTTFWDKNESASYNKLYTIACSEGSKTNSMTVESCSPAAGESSCLGKLKYNFANTNIVHFCRSENYPYSETAMTKFSDHSNFQSTGATNEVPVQIKAGVANNFYMLGAPVGGDPNKVNGLDCSGAGLSSVNGVYALAAPTATPIPTRIPPPTDTPVPTRIPSPSGTITANPTSCTIPYGQPGCGSGITISWTSENNAGVQIRIGSITGGVWASGGASGSQTLSASENWIGPQGMNFHLMAANGEELNKVFVAGNPGPVPTNTPVPPTATIPPAYLRSDFGGLGGPKDGKVDLQDYNILVFEFNQTGTTLKSDIAKGGNSLNKIDIQDYNIFVIDFLAYLRIRYL